ncbi:SERTA domain-containing protein 3 [Megalops cyprinoides]|uniref:SERTA domain-containing protein 3 n=1 Tax=Megalops cyprinoides TaxID=118141 RepID=UPI0018642FF8|nr:SERTA domain-containing protein 3 [Megalops cyprinoides]
MNGSSLKTCHTSNRSRMMGKGLKRKLLDPPEGGSVVYESQRQSVLDISLDKFQHSQMMVEPSLRRSVLIANTLRQIQEEIRLEGATLAQVRAPHRAAPAVPEPCPREEAPPTRPPPASRPQSVEDAGDDWMALSSEEDFSLSSAISSILKDLDMVIDGGSTHSPQAPPRTPLGSIENLPGDAGPKLQQQELVAGAWRADRCTEGCRPPEGAVFGSFEVMRSSYLRDVALDDLFLDIDTSVYERETSPQGARTVSSAAGDELLKYLPALSSPAASPFSLSQNVRDLNELEHIMEILVGS